MAVVCDLVSEIGDLRLERAGLGIKSFAFARVIIRGKVLYKPFTSFPGEIEAIVAGIFLFELLYNTQALAVMLKAAVVGHQFVERMLALVA
ncbi:uncharacterized protein METZ01_LOCUS167520, partial [marine metagenome]